MTCQRFLKGITPCFFWRNFYGKSRGINFLWSKHDHRSIATWGEIGVLELSWCQLLPSCLTLWRTFCWYLKCSETKLELVVVCLVDPFWHSIFLPGFSGGKAWVGYLPVASWITFAPGRRPHRGGDYDSRHSWRVWATEGGEIGGVVGGLERDFFGEQWSEGVTGPKRVDNHLGFFDSSWSIRNRGLGIFFFERFIAVKMIEDFRKFGGAIHQNNCTTGVKRRPQTDMGFSKNRGTQQPWVFLLKMIILGCFGGTPIFGNPHMIIKGFEVKAILYMGSVLRFFQMVRECLGACWDAFFFQWPKRKAGFPSSTFLHSG